MSIKAQLWTINGLAAEFDLDRKTVIKRLSNVAPDATEQSGRVKKYYMKHVARYLLKISDQDVGSEEEMSNLDPQQEQAKLNKKRREKIALEILMEKGKLIPANLVREYWANVVVNAKTKLMAMPSKIAHRVVAAEDFQEAKCMIEEEVREAITELSTDGIPDDVEVIEDVA